MNEEGQKLYEMLSRDGFVTLPKDEFVQKMQDPQHRIKLHSLLSRDGILSDKTPIDRFNSFFSTTTQPEKPFAGTKAETVAPVKTFAGGAETVANPIKPPVEAVSGTMPSPGLFGIPGTQETAQTPEPTKSPTWMSPAKMMQLQQSVSKIPQEGRNDFIINLQQKAANAVAGKIDPSTGQKFEPLTFEERYTLKYLLGEGAKEARPTLETQRLERERNPALQQKQKEAAAQAAKTATGEVKTPDLVAQTQKDVEKEKQLIPEQNKMFVSKEQAVGAEAKQKYGENYEPGLIRDNSELALDKIKEQFANPSIIQMGLDMATGMMGGKLFNGSVMEQQRQYAKWITESGLIRERNALETAGKHTEAVKMDNRLVEFYKENNIDPSKGTFFQQVSGKNEDQAVGDAVGTIESAQKKVPEGWDKLSPKGKLAVHYGALERERQQLDAKYNLSQEWAAGSRTFGNVADWIQGADPYQADARKRYWEIQTELNGLAPFMAVPSYSPENDPEKWKNRMMGKVAEAFNLSIGATPTDKFAKAQALGNVLLQAGENIPKNVKKTLSEMETPWHFVSEELPSTAIQSAAMVVPMMIPGIGGAAAARVFGLATRLVGLTGKGINTAQAFNYGRSIANSPLVKFGLNAIEEGSKYAAAGFLLPKHGDELNFTSGVAGAAGVAFLNKLGSGLTGMAGGMLGKANMEKLAPMLQKWQLQLSGAKEMTGKGLGEVGEEFAETVAQMAQDDRDGEFSKQFEAQFGTASKTLKFFLSTFLLGAGMGGGSVLGKKFTQKQKADFEKLTPDDQEKAKAFMDQNASAVVDGTAHANPELDIKPNTAGDDVLAQIEQNKQKVADFAAQQAERKQALTDMVNQLSGDPTNPDLQGTVQTGAAELSKTNADLKAAQDQGKQLDKDFSQSQTDAKAYSVAALDREIEMIKTQNNRVKETIKTLNQDIKNVPVLANGKPNAKKIEAIQNRIVAYEKVIASNQDRIKEIKQSKEATNNAPLITETNAPQTQETAPPVGVNGEPVLQPGQQVPETGQNVNVGEGNVQAPGGETSQQPAVAPTQVPEPGREGQPVEPPATQGGSTVATPKAGQVAPESKENVPVGKGIRYFESYHPHENYLTAENPAEGKSDIGTNLFQLQEQTNGTAFVLPINDERSREMLETWMLDTQTIYLFEGENSRDPNLRPYIEILEPAIFKKINGKWELQKKGKIKWVETRPTKNDFLPKEFRYQLSNKPAQPQATDNKKLLDKKKAELEKQKGFLSAEIKKNPIESHAAIRRVHAIGIESTQKQVANIERQLAQSNEARDAENKKLLNFGNTIGKLFGNAPARFASDSELEKHKKQTQADTIGWYDKDAHEIVLNPNLATAETPLHEATHIFLDSLKEKAPAMYARLEAEAKRDPMFKELSKRYKGIGDAAEEVIAHKIGAFLKGNLDADYNMKDPEQVKARNTWAQFAKQIWEWIKRQLALTVSPDKRADIMKQLEAKKDSITISELGKLLAGEIAKGKEVVKEVKKGVEIKKVEATLEQQLAGKKDKLQKLNSKLDKQAKDAATEQNRFARKAIAETNKEAIESSGLKQDIASLEKQLSELRKTGTRYSLAEAAKTGKEYIAKSFKTFQENILGDFFGKQLKSDEFKRMSQGQKETHKQAIQILRDNGIDFDPTSAFYKENLKPIEDALKTLENAKDGYVDMATNPKAFEKFEKDVREQLLTPNSKGETAIDNLNTKIEEVYEKISGQLGNTLNKEANRADATVMAMGLLAKMQEDVYTGVSQMAVGLFDALRPENGDANKAAQARLELPVTKDEGEAYSILTENGIDSDAKKDLIKDLAMKGNILFKNGISEILYAKLAETATNLGRGLNALNYLKRMGRTGVMQMVDRVKTAINTVNGTDRVNDAAKGFVDSLKELFNKGIDAIQNNPDILKLLEKLKGLLNKNEGNVLPDTDATAETDAELEGITSDTDMLTELVLKLHKKVTKDIKQDTPLTQEQIDSKWESMLLQELIKRASQVFDTSILAAGTTQKITSDSEKFIAVLANHQQAQRLLLDAQPELLKKIQDSKKLNPAQKARAVQYIGNYLTDPNMFPAYSERTKMRAIREAMKESLAMNATAIAKLPPDQRDAAIKTLMDDFEKRVAAQGGAIAPFAADIRKSVDDYISEKATEKLNRLFEIAQQRAAVKQNRDGAWTVKPAVKSIIDLMNLMKNSGITNPDQIINDPALYNLLKDTANSLNITSPQLAELWNLTNGWTNDKATADAVEKWMAARKQSQILTNKLLNKLTPKTPQVSKEKALADKLYDVARKKLDARNTGAKVAPPPQTMEEMKAELDALMSALTSKEAADAWKEAAGALKGKDPDLDAIFNMKPEDLLDGNKSIDKLAKAGAKDLGYVTADGKLDLRKIIKDSQRDQGDAVEKVKNRILSLGDPKDPQLIDLAEKVSKQFKQKIQDAQVKEAQDYIERQKEKQSYLHKARRTIYGWVRKGETQQKTQGEMEKFMERFNMLASIENDKTLDDATLKIAKDHFSAEFGGVKMTPEEWKAVERAIEFVQQLPDGQEKAMALEALNAQLYSNLPGAAWTQLGQIWTNRLLQALRTQYVQLIQNQVNIATEYIGHALKIYFNKNIPPSQRTRQFVKTWRLFMQSTKDGIASGMEGLKHGYKYSDSISEDAPQEGITGGSILENPQFKRGWGTYIAPGEKFLGARFQTAIDRYNASAVQVLGYYNMAIDANMQSEERQAEIEHLSKSMSKAKAMETVYLEVKKLVDSQLGLSKNIENQLSKERLQRLGEMMQAKEGRDLTPEEIKALEAGEKTINMKTAVELAKAETAELATKIAGGFTRSIAQTNARAREMMRQQNLDATIRERSDEVARVASLKSGFGGVALLEKGMGSMIDGFENEMKKNGFNVLASRFAKIRRMISQVFVPFWTTLFRLADRNMDFVPGVGLINLGIGSLGVNKADPAQAQRLADLSQMIYRRQIGGTIAFALGAGVQAILSALRDDKDKCGGRMGVTGSRKFTTAGQREADPCLPNSVYFGDTRINLDYFGGIGLAMRVLGAVNDMLDEKEFAFHKAQASKAGATDADGDGEPDITWIDLGMTTLRGLFFSVLDATPYKTQRDLLNTMTEPSRGEHDNKWARFVARQGGSIAGRLVPYNKPAQEIIDMIGSFTNSDLAAKRSGKTVEEAFLSSMGLTKYFNEVKRDIFGGAVAADYIWSTQNNKDLKNLYTNQGKLISLPKNYTVEVNGVARKLSPDELLKYVELYKQNLGNLVRPEYGELKKLTPAEFSKKANELSRQAREAAKSELGLEISSERKKGHGIKKMSKGHR